MFPPKNNRLKNSSIFKLTATKPYFPSFEGLSGKTFYIAISFRERKESSVETVVRAVESKKKFNSSSMLSLNTKAKVLPHISQKSSFFSLNPFHPQIHSYGISINAHFWCLLSGSRKEREEDEEFLTAKRKTFTLNSEDSSEKSS